MSETFHVLFFACGDEAEQVAIGLGAKGFCAVAVIMEKTGGKGAWRTLTVFGFQFVERGQGDAVSAVEMAEGFKDFGFELMVRTVARECGAPGTRAPGLRRFCAIWDGGARGFRVMGWVASSGWSV